MEFEEIHREFSEAIKPREPEFKENILRFLRTKGYDREVMDRLEKNHAYFREKLLEIDKDISEQDRSDLKLLKTFGTVVDLLEENNMEPKGLQLEKIPELYMTIEELMKLKTFKESLQNIKDHVTSKIGREWPRTTESLLKFFPNGHDIFKDSKHFKSLNKALNGFINGVEVRIEIERGKTIKDLTKEELETLTPEERKALEEREKYMNGLFGRFGGSNPIGQAGVTFETQLLASNLDIKKVREGAINDIRNVYLPMFRQAIYVNSPEIEPKDAERILKYYTFRALIKLLKKEMLRGEDLKRVALKLIKPEKERASVSPLSVR